MTDSIDPLIAPTADTSVEADPTDAQALPDQEETPEAWVLRFLEENQHLASPPVAAPPAPPPAPWDGPVSSWKVPDHLSVPHPDGGYMAMALMSRMMGDLDEVTGGTRAATYAEVDTYLGHALIAEGLVPRTYTADEATHWWKAGGYKVLRGTPDNMPDTPSTGDTAPDILDTGEMARTGSSVDMNANGMMIDDVVDPSQAGPGPITPARQTTPAGQTAQAVPGTAPAPAPVAAASTTAAAATPTGNQGIAPATGPAQGKVQPTGNAPSRGTIRTSANNIPNRIVGAYLPQSDLILALQNGLLSSMAPDTGPGAGGLNTDKEYAKAVRGARKITAIANVDVSADPDAIAFVKAIAPALANARTKVDPKAKAKAKSPSVEKYLMVEWDSGANRYVVTGIKILPGPGGSIGDLKPRFADTAAIWGKSRPRAFVIHTHLVDNGYSEIPGPRDADVVKSLLVPNFVVEDNAKNPIIHQVTMTAGKADPKSGKSKQPRISVIKMLGNGGLRTVPRYKNMPE